MAILDRDSSVVEGREGTSVDLCSLKLAVTVSEGERETERVAAGVGSVC